MSLPLPRWVLAALACVAVAVGIVNLARPLANPDEGRYSEISREMAASGDWVTPRLNGLKYFEKPPLQYWATALAFEAFGANEAAARLYVWLAGFATILVVGYTALRLFDAATALASMLVLVSSPYFMALGGIVTLDMGLTLWTTATLACLLLAESSRPSVAESRRWMLGAWVAVALAVLSKGLVGIVFAGAAVFFAMVLARDASVLRRMRWGAGLALAAAIAVPWFVAVSRANPEFAHFFFVHEHFERFLTQEHRRVQPAWFFVPIVLAGFLPWAFALPAAIARAWREEAGRAFAPLRLSILWSAFVLAFFSASGSKLPAYVLPLFPPLAIVLGCYLAAADPRRLAAWVALVLPVAGILAWAAWTYPASAKDAWTAAMYAAAQPWAVAASITLAAAAAAAVALLRRGRRWPAIATLAFAAMLLMGCLQMGSASLSPRQSGAAVAQAMKPWLAGGPRIYSVNHYDQSVPFYIGRTVTLVDYVDEFETGEKAEPALWIPKFDAFAAEWQRPGDALAIMQPGAFEKSKAAGLPMQVLHEDPRRILVRKP
ncbi:MAG: phospholipid carrier-dependent glycosyltransferase [Usitatibacter sp.]